MLLKEIQKEEVKGRRGRRRKQLLGDLKETRGYCKLKEEIPDRAVWRTGLGRDSGHVVRPSTNIYIDFAVLVMLNYL